MRIKGLLVALTLSVPFMASSQEVCPTLSDTQLDVLKQSYQLGEPHDLGYTLAAIAMKESSAGMFVINAISGDYGVFQGNVETICKQAGVYHNAFQCNVEIQQTVNDIDFAAKHAIETLSYWRNYHKKRAPAYLVYENMIRSYNGGFGFERVTSYWEEYREQFHMIKRCIDFTA